MTTYPLPPKLAEWAERAVGLLSEVSGCPHTLCEAQHDSEKVDAGDPSIGCDHLVWPLDQAKRLVATVALGRKLPTLVIDGQKYQGTYQEVHAAVRAAISRGEL